jgi:uncharacterized phiE125 gp8 family phage protein
MTWLPIETTVAPASEPITMGQLREWCRIDGSDQDSTLLGLMIAARQSIEDVTGIRLVTQTVKLRRAGFCDALYLPIAPVQSVTVEYLDADGVSQTLSSDVYETYLFGLAPMLSRVDGESWPSVYASPAAVTITAVVGYGDINAAPEPVRLALQFLVSGWFDNRGESAWPEVVKSLLAPYRRYAF